MTDIEIQKIARNKILKGTVIVVTVLIILLLLGTAKEGFEKGMALFLNAKTIHILIMLILLFGLTYIFAGYAGQEIIIERQNIFLISFKYVVLIAAITSIYIVLAAFLMQHDFTLEAFKNAISIYFFPLFIKTGFWLLIVWLWTTNKLKSIKV